MLPLAACDTEELLQVDDPTFASPETLNTVAGLPTLIAGAIGDFQVGYSGPGGDSFLSVVALLSDEKPTRRTPSPRAPSPISARSSPRVREHVGWGIQFCNKPDGR